MLNDAQITLAGYVATEPKFRTTAAGVPVASLRVAHTPRHLNRQTGEWSDGQTMFVSVVCWRGLADNVALCLRKGEPVLVHGRMHFRSYQGRDGEQRQVIEVEASSIGHDLARGAAHFQRTRRSAGETAAELAAGGTDQPDSADPGDLADLADPELADPDLADPELAGADLEDPEMGGSGLARPGLGGNGVIDDRAIAGLIADEGEPVPDRAGA